MRRYNGADSNVPSLVLTQRFIYVRGGSVVEVSRISSILVTRDLDLKSCNDAANKITSKKETLQVIRRVLPIHQESPIHFALLGRKRKYIKSKTTAKLIEIRTSIAAVRDKLGQIDTFLNPLLSGCLLLLIANTQMQAVFMIIFYVLCHMTFN